MGSWNLIIAMAYLRIAGRSDRFGRDNATDRFCASLKALLCVGLWPKRLTMLGYVRSTSTYGTCIFFRCQNVFHANRTAKKMP